MPTAEGLLISHIESYWIGLSRLGMRGCPPQAQWNWSNCIIRCHTEGSGSSEWKRIIVLVGLLCLRNYLLLETYNNHDKNHKWVQNSEMSPSGLWFLLKCLDVSIIGALCTPGTASNNKLSELVCRHSVWPKVQWEPSNKKSCVARHQDTAGRCLGTAIRSLDFW